MAVLSLVTRRHARDKARVATKHRNTFGGSSCNLGLDLVGVGADDDDGIGFGSNGIFHATGHLAKIALGVNDIGFPAFLPASSDKVLSISLVVTDCWSGVIRVMFLACWCWRGKAKARAAAAKAK
jgi:hypothetical protein